MRRKDEMGMMTTPQNPGKSIRSRVIKTEMVDWRNLEWFQGGLKELTKESYDRLKHSLIENQFIMPFHVWLEDTRGKTGGKRWILDGHHRQRVMIELEKEGYEIPRDLPAVFINCQDRREASKLVLVYSSIYANVTEEGLYAFLSANEVDFNELMTSLDLPEFDVDRFIKGYLQDHPGKEFDETIAEGVELCHCPTCGHEHAKKV